jgi:hypothetical protein
MKILFDQGTPVPLRRFLGGHEIVSAFELGCGAPCRMARCCKPLKRRFFSPLSPPIRISDTSKTYPPAGLRCSS